jgi:ubiquinone/menaquinone biosynthesis C-methylase UbiE
VRTLSICEPELAMARRLQKRIADRRPHAAFVRAAAEELPFDHEQFDVAVSTLVLCSVDDQSQALRELRRVLRPTGRLLFIEHVRADDARLARWQDRITPLHVRLTNGCHCNRRTLDGIRGAGFEITQLRHDTLKHVPPFVPPLIIGVSERPGT